VITGDSVPAGTPVHSSAGATNVTGTGVLAGGIVPAMDSEGSDCGVRRAPSRLARGSSLTRNSRPTIPGWVCSTYRSLVYAHGSNIGLLPHALADGDRRAGRLAGRRPAVFLDYDGTLTAIGDPPEDPLVSGSMREAMRALAARCRLRVVSGRDRRVVQQLMGVDDLVVAGSHGFDIWRRDTGTVEREEDAGFEELVERVTARLREEVGLIDGALIEPKRSSVALHPQLVREAGRARIAVVVDALLADLPGELKVTPAKMVYETLPASTGTGQGGALPARGAGHRR
jgi:hypothetical protein